MNTTILIIIVLSLIIIGIFSFVVELKSIRSAQQKILKFRDKVVDFYEKSNTGKKTNKEWSYILSNYKEVYRLMSPHCYRPSTYDFVTSVMNHNRYNIASDVACLDKEVVSTISEYELEFKKDLSQWWNVFSHFFRGIGTVLRIVFQYPIKLIKPEFDFKSKGWNLLCAIIGILGSIASIISFII